MMRQLHRMIAVATPAAVAACSPSAAPPAAAPQAAASTEHAAHHRQHRLHKDFSDAESFAAHFDDPARDAWQKPDAVVDLLHIPPGSTVVDLGAGTGYFVARLAQRVGDRGRVLALDIEPKMVEFLGRRAKEQQLTNVEPRLVAPDDPLLAPASVSRILIVDTWHHIDDRASYASKLAAALAPEGEVWIVDFTLESQFGPPREYRVAAEEAARELEQGGLHATIIEPEPLPEQYIVRGSR